MQHDGVRTLRPLAQAADWFGCFDTVQLNEDEMRQLSPDPLTLSAQALSAGVRLLIVTLGARGAAYVAAPAPGAPVQSALVPAPAVDAADPTGCGEVFGATACARLVAGESTEDALRRANAAAARSAGYRGATGLARHLRGELVTL
jgi:sugar/nucleoside kinase (ribokinase family)